MTHRTVRANLDRIVAHLTKRRGIHTALLAVESGDGTFRWDAAAGHASDGTPVGRETPFCIASIDKLWTSVVVLQLAEQGLLTLDTGIAECLPPSLWQGIHRMDGVDRSDQITVRHLLSHTSGLADYLEDAPRRGRSLVEVIVAEGDRSWSFEEAIALVRDRLEPHFPPASRTDRRVRIRYSDTNYLLLMAVIAAASGRSVQDAFDSFVFRPLELRHTWIAGLSAPADPTPPATNLWVRDQVLDVPLALASLVGIYSTVDDLIASMRAIVDGSVFTDPATADRLRSPWRRFGLPKDRAALRSPSWPIEYGLGIKRFQLPRVLSGRHPMPAVIGHTGSTGTWLFHCPERDLFLAGSVDQVTAGAVPYRLVPRLLTAIGDGTSRQPGGG
jgi:D-alanyl-D-alanine carboxypeptidase